MALVVAPSRFTALETELSALAEATRAGVAAVRDGNGRGGAGVVWDDGLVISNHHVVSSDSCRLVFAGGSMVDARVIARDSEHDLVAVEFAVDSGETVRPIPRRVDLPLRPGELVVALGHPGGIEWALTIGILTGVSHNQDRRSLLRASVTLQPGNSGGPLLDAHGNLIGINAMLTGPAEAIAIPISVVERFVQEISHQK